MVSHAVSHNSGLTGLSKTAWRFSAGEAWRRAGLRDRVGGTPTAPVTPAAGGRGVARGLISTIGARLMSGRG